jgi:hypothetical protein
MRVIIAPEFYEQLLQTEHHPDDCCVRPGEYPHHLYFEGVKYIVAQAVVACMEQAMAAEDQEAIDHLHLHKVHYEMLLADAARYGSLEGVTLLGDPPPSENDTPAPVNQYLPRTPTTWEETGLELPFLFDSVLRTIFIRGQITGGMLAEVMALPFAVLNPVLQMMRKQLLIDIVAQRGNSGDASFVYEVKPPKGTSALHEAMEKTNYVGPSPVPFSDYVESVVAQTVRKITVTRRTIRKAFEDLIISEAAFNEIGPAINSAQSIFFFGYPGNGKTSIAERITRLMGDQIYIPYAVIANGQIIKLYDPILHTAATKGDDEGEFPSEAQNSVLLNNSVQFDKRYIKVKRPTIVVGGELTMPMLDLKFNDIGKYYEAPLQMKANGGIFMIDDFGRQLMRPMDLLNRWIVPLEKKYDYLTTNTGTKIEVPFDQILIFSTNLDPTQLADEAFLRRIKFKIEVRDPSEEQYRKIWELVCRGRRVEFDPSGIDYLIRKWYLPMNRPYRMCQPRDILDQMISIAKYNMERVNFSPDLIDAACGTYFISDKKRDFGAKVRID